MTEDEATREVGWVARRARYLVHAPYVPAEHVEFYERKAALLEHAGQSSVMSDQSRAESARMAETARKQADAHRMTAWPHHYRDGGAWCPWSGVEHRGAGACPNGCSGSLEHYANDGHPECSDA